MLSDYSDAEIKQIIEDSGGVTAASKKIGCHHSSIRRRLKSGEDLTKEDIEKIKAIIKHHPEDSDYKITNRTFIPVSAKTVKKIRNNMNKSNVSEFIESKNQPKNKGETECDVQENPVTGDVNLTVKSLNIQTVEQALEYANIDIEDFYISKKRVTSSEVTMGKNKTHSGEPETYTNFNISVELKRIENDALYKSFKSLINKLPKLPAVDTPEQSEQANLLMEMCLFDHHFGSLAWKAETNEDYDVRIAQKIFMYAVRQFLQPERIKNVGQILMPIGNDFLHVNNVEGQTPKHKNRLDTDCRLPKIFQIALQTIIMAIKECAEVAPVHVLWVPGNHDPHTGFYIACALEQLFKDSPDITIDASPTPRKYYRHGLTLIEYDHGEDPKDEFMPGLMAEERKDFGECIWKECHRGHIHKKKETHVNVANTFNGTKVMHLPSLAGTDFWHFSKGYVRDMKTVEANYYTSDGIPAGNVPAVIPQSLYVQH